MDLQRQNKDDKNPWLLKGFPITLRVRIKYEAGLLGLTMPEYVAKVFHDLYNKASK